MTPVLAFSGISSKIVNRHFNIAQNSAQQSRPNGFARMNRHDGRSSVLMSQESMAALGADYAEACAFENADEFLALEPGKAGHTEIC